MRPGTFNCLGDEGGEHGAGRSTLRVPQQKKFGSHSNVIPVPARLIGTPTQRCRLAYRAGECSRSLYVSIITHDPKRENEASNKRGKGETKRWTGKKKRGKREKTQHKLMFMFHVVPCG